MRKHNKSKINHLYQILPEGFIADAKWLTAAGYPSSLRNRYIKSGWLLPVVRGVFRRPLYRLGAKEAIAPLSWQHIVASLQLVMRLPVAVGGRTALELSGYAHYVSDSAPREVHIYSDIGAPGWLNKIPLDTTFVFHNANKLFPKVPIFSELEKVSTESRYGESKLPNESSSLTWFNFGTGNWPIFVSTPERAVLEVLDELPDRETFEQVNMLMESLVDISPGRIGRVLRECRSIKVKRLFFWFVERQNHLWLERLDRDGVELGSGKRMLVKGGRMNPKYLITVPRGFEDHG